MTSKTETQSETQAVVERLTAREKFFREWGYGTWDDDLASALALISRQQEEIEGFKAALYWIGNRCPKETSLQGVGSPNKHHAEAMHDAGVCARAALQAKP